MRRLFRIAGMIAVVVLASGSAAVAHPLGKFTVNHLTRLTVADRTLHAR